MPKYFIGFRKYNFSMVIGVVIKDAPFSWGTKDQQFHADCSITTVCDENFNHDLTKEVAIRLDQFSHAMITSDEEFAKKVWKKWLKYENKRIKQMNVETERHKNKMKDIEQEYSVGRNLTMVFVSNNFPDKHSVCLSKNFII